MLNGRINILAWSLLLILAACRGIDDNSGYTTGTVASYFLLSDPSSGVPEIAELRGETFTPDWLSSLEIAPYPLSDMELSGHKMWVCSAAKQTAFEYDLRKNELTNGVHFESLRPDQLSIGDKTIMVADRVKQSVAIRHLKKETTVEYDLSTSPEEIIYAGGKYYVHAGCCEIILYNETAMAEVNRFSLQDTIIALRFNSGLDVVALSHSGGNTTQSLLDANADILLYEGTVVSFNDIRYSPWFSQKNGTEYLGDVMLSNGGLNTVPPISPVSAYDVDFFSGYIYYQWNDTLNSRSLHDPSITGKYYTKGKLLKAFHYLDTYEK